MALRAAPPPAAVETARPERFIDALETQDAKGPVRVSLRPRFARRRGSRRVRPKRRRLGRRFNSAVRGRAAHARSKSALCVAGRDGDVRRRGEALGGTRERVGLGAEVPRFRRAPERKRRPENGILFDRRGARAPRPVGRAAALPPVPRVGAAPRGGGFCSAAAAAAPGMVAHALGRRPLGAAGRPRRVPLCSRRRRAAPRLAGHDRLPRRARRRDKRRALGPGNPGRFARGQPACSFTISKSSTALCGRAPRCAGKTSNASPPCAAARRPSCRADCCSTPTRSATRRPRRSPTSTGTPPP
mmetsp:Transcript_31002/g.106620  ORF Transcript_31002/g.106620 Transcript_31002/m.106620 type:complete len:301 (-) Transcript_31002:1717-2619(-)